MKTFVVIGLGRFGESVARELYAAGNEVLAIDTEENLVQKIADSVTHAVVADAKDESVLRSLGIRNYDCAIVAMGEDVTDSVLVALALKELEIPMLICKASNLQHKKILEKIGADRVLIPEREMGRKLATQLSLRHLRDYIQLAPEMGICEIDVPENWVGRVLRELDIRKRYSLNVIAVKKLTENKAVTPGPEYCFELGDIAVVIGSDEDVAAIAR